MDKEYIDLGCGLDSEPMEATSEPKKSYPCFYFTCDEKIDLPDGEFKFMAVGRKVDTGENTRDPDDPRYRYEIEVQGFKPMGGVNKEGTDMGEKFKKGLMKGMEERMGKEYPEGDEG